ncbi:MAG: hypothetical protein ACLFNJ_11270 [Bacteroidales bacterium]
MFELMMNQGLTEKAGSKAICKECGAVFQPNRKFETLCLSCQRDKENVMMAGAK